MYSIYLGNTLLPITPAKLSTKIKNKNKVITLINEGDINVLKAAGLAEISFTAVLPYSAYPFAQYENGVFHDVKYYLDAMEKLKTDAAAFRFVCARVIQKNQAHSTNMLVSLESYEIVEDAKKGLDTSVKIKLKAYRPYSTKIVTIADEDKSEVVVDEPRPEGDEPAVTTYTVVRGDCLWNIAKRYLGKGSRYREIYDLNRDKITNPNLIYPGQVLTMPQE